MSDRTDAAIREALGGQAGAGCGPPPVVCIGPGRRMPPSPIWTPAISRPTSRPGRQVRLHAALGRADGKSPWPCCSSRYRRKHRHRQPAAIWRNCAAISSRAPHPLLGHVGRERGRRDGHGSGRIPRRRHRPFTAVRHAAVLVGMVDHRSFVTYGILMFQGRGFRPDGADHRRARGRVPSASATSIEMFIAPVAWGQASARGTHRARRMPDVRRH